MQAFLNRPLESTGRGGVEIDAAVNGWASCWVPAEPRASAKQQARVNEEVKRRMRVVGILPNDTAITRPVGAVLLEHGEHGQLEGRRMLFAEKRAAVMAPGDLHAQVRHDLSGSDLRNGSCVLSPGTRSSQGCRFPVLTTTRRLHPVHSRLPRECTPSP